MTKLAFTASFIFFSAIIYAQEINIANDNIQVSPAVAVTYEPSSDRFTHNDIIDSDYTNRKDGTPTIEKNLVGKNETPTIIEGMNKVVPLTNEGNLTFEWDFEGGEHNYENSIMTNRFHSYKSQSVEESGYFFVAGESNKKTYCIGESYSNPSGNIIISINDDLETQRSFTGIQIFAAKEGKSIKQITKFSTEWGPLAVKWINDNTLIIKYYTLGWESNYEPIENYVKVVVDVN